MPVHRNAIGFNWYSSLTDNRVVLLRLLTRRRDVAIFWMRVTVVHLLAVRFLLLRQVTYHSVTLDSSDP